jgi:hypothetical protein
MNEGMTGDPKRGQVWSLKVHDREKESPAVLLCKEPEESGAPFVALPILEESWLACDQDVLLSEDEDWLLGLGWCMAWPGGHEIEVARDRLRAHLTEVDALTLGLARDFKAGKDCALPTSHRLVPELGDPRVEARAEYLKFVRQCARVRAWKLVIRWVESKVEALLTGPTMEEVQPSLEYLAPGATRAKSEEEDSPCRDVITLDLPYELRILLRRDKLAWQATFEAVKGDIEDLVLVKEEKKFPLERVDNEWFTEEAMPIGSGYRLHIDGKLGKETVQLDLDSR